MSAINIRKFGRIGFDITDMGFGAAPIGNFLRPIPETEAGAMIDRAWEAGMRYFDTAPYYGHGLSELRLGHYLRWKPRRDYVISSKVGRVLTAARREDIDFKPWVDGAAFKSRFDYSYDGTMRSFEDSLQRLGLEYIDILFIHDADVFTHGVEMQKVYFRQAMDGCYRALIKLREQGLVKAIGVGVNNWEVMLDFMQAGDFDTLLVAGRYTLLEQDALNELLPLCERRGTAIVIGGGFNGGILATGAVPGAKWNYAPAPAHIMEKVRRIEAVCARYKVPLAAAALQFLLAHPAVASHVPGTRTVEQMDQNLALVAHPIPKAFWQELKSEGLVRQDAPVPA
ncbi:aldo/keto reductase [Aestuariivirga sp.]|jgi:D-threo-aldose 1-dehydrogenase|uniref:aldo/keto reductase n=1 Tax=Aestuariivirga sp. TaxID=2650926 RepID=UPI00378308B2